MGSWLFVWLILTAITTVAIIAVLVALARHVLLVGRTARRLQDEVSPITADITTGLDRASTRASSLKPPSFGANGR